MYVKTLNGLSLNGAWQMQLSLYAGWIAGAASLYLLFGTEILAHNSLLLTIYLLSGLSVILCTFIRKKDNFKLLPKFGISAEVFLLGISMAIALVMVKDGLGYLLPLPAWPELSFTSIHTGSIYNIIVSVMLFAFMEEMLFRGIIMEALLQRYSGGIALLQSSLLFMLAHPDPAQMPGTFLLGLLTGVFYLRLRDLCGAMLVHLTHNVAAAFVLSAGSYQFVSSSPLSYALLVTGCAAALIGGYFLLKKVTPPPAIKIPAPEKIRSASLLLTK